MDEIKIRKEKKLHDNIKLELKKFMNESGGVPPTKEELAKIE